MDHIEGSVQMNEPMSRHTTLQVGGPVDLWVEPSSLEDCKRALAYASDHDMTPYIIGRGSNLLVRDGGLRGMVLHVGDAFRTMDVAEKTADRTIVNVGAGVMIRELLNWTADQGLSGIEGLEGVPGTVGGAIAMNAGTPHGEIGDAVHTVTLLEKGKVVTRSRDKMEFSYRKSKLSRSSMVVSVQLALTPADPASIRATLQKYRGERQAKQPLQQPSVGSVFKNPENVSAGQLIEEAGLKGVRVGKAQVSTHHANWIVNLGGASAKDIEVLIRLVRDTVKEKLGVVLEPEVKIVGEAL